METSAKTTYHIDGDASNVRFEISSFKLMTTPGVFHDVSGTVHMSEDDLSTLEVEAQIDAASIDTGNEDRDEHLRDADFLEVEAHPVMRFESRAVHDVRGRDFALDGALTLHGTERPITLQARLEDRGDAIIRFAADATLDRTDYGVEWDSLLETGGLVVGHEVGITLDVVARSA